ncbi:MAG TPA: class I SAM-dependent methyltransferase [Dehalococcoidia bacterium]|nr:class I SAM-dependent methyltransferase [Dehalococcoidia bacterium]
MTSPWYQAFYGRDYLEIYDFYLTSERTAQELAFIQKTLALQPGQRLLDLCSGHGRHAIPLAQTGLKVAGIDQSLEYLKMATASARDQKVNVANLHGDMRYLPFGPCFDAAINVFSSFGYLENEAEDAMVLRSVAKVLKPGGPFLIDLISREWVLRNYVESDWHEGSDGTLYLERRGFDFVESREHVTFLAIAPDGSRREIPGHHIRLYTLRELVGMLDAAGLRFEQAYGGFDGQPYSVDTRRMIVLARKPG